MWPVHQRIAELWYKKKFGEGITESEEKELQLCLDAHMRKAMELVRLYNLSLCASYSEDTQWQLEICREIEKIKAEMADVPYLG